MLAARAVGSPWAICSACTANPLALEAVLDHAELSGAPALVEATPNQVNQFGGYTGMTPAGFASFVARMQEGRRCEVILGGDHLGPVVWRGLPQAEAMANAAELVGQCAAVGFQKIHIDTSMSLMGDPLALGGDAIAARAAFLCERAEAAADPSRPPVYVIGSEVPVPGGAQRPKDVVEVTRPEDFLATVASFRDAFAARGLQGAWERVVAVVVQPGVEFGDEHVFAYDRARASRLAEALAPLSPLVFEGHSTDYQAPGALRQMAEDGVAIQKVGPALTFALREALFSLSEMEKWLVPAGGARSRFTETLEEAMLRDPSNWERYYRGSPEQQAFKRRFSLSDRARYYLPDPAVEQAAAKLMANIDACKPPLSLVSQYMPSQFERLREGIIQLSARELVKSRVADCLSTYPTPCWR